MQRHDIQDATGVVVRKPNVGIMQVVSATTPTNGQAGYGPGCLWQNHSGSAGTVLYVNTGTNTSTTWVAIA